MATKIKPPTNWDTVPEVFDYSFAAVVCGYSVSHLNLMIRKGQFPAVKRGRKVLCNKADVRAWCEGRWQPAAQGGAAS